MFKILVTTWDREDSNPFMTDVIEFDTIEAAVYATNHVNANQRVTDGNSTIDRFRREAIPLFKVSE